MGLAEWISNLHNVMDFVNLVKLFSFFTGFGEVAVELGAIFSTLNLNCFNKLKIEFSNQWRKGDSEGSLPFF